MANFFKRIFGKHPPEEIKPEKEANVPINKPNLNESIADNELPFNLMEDLKRSPTESSVKGLKVEETLTTSDTSVYDLSAYKHPTYNLFSSIHHNYFDKFKYLNQEFSIPVLWSADNEQLVIKDLAELKTILITGVQETGKTRFIHQLLISLLLKKHPSQLKLILADAKGIEFNEYAGLERHFLAKLPGETDIIEDSFKLANTLNAVCIELDNRFELFKSARTRNIKEYNAKIIAKELDLKKEYHFLPYIILVIDDLGAFSQKASSELNLSMLKIVGDGYKTGIFTILATSQFGGHSLPSELRSLFVQRVVFNLNHKDDYKKFFDTVKLKSHLEPGEFLYNDGNNISSGYNILFDFEEIQNLIRFISEQKGYPHAFLLSDPTNQLDWEGKDFDLADRDSLFEDAAKLIVQNQIGSTSLLQRRLKLGYNRAGRLMEQLEAAGIVGPNQGSTARDVLIKTENELQKHLNAMG